MVGSGGGVTAEEELPADVGGGVAGAGVGDDVGDAVAGEGVVELGVVVESVEAVEVAEEDGAGFLGRGAGVVEVEVFLRKWVRTRRTSRSSATT